MSDGRRYPNGSPRQPNPRRWRRPEQGDAWDAIAAAVDRIPLTSPLRDEEPRFRSERCKAAGCGQRSPDAGAHLSQKDHRKWLRTLGWSWSAGYCRCPACVKAGNTRETG